MVSTLEEKIDISNRKISEIDNNVNRFISGIDKYSIDSENSKFNYEKLRHEISVDIEQLTMKRIKTDLWGTTLLVNILFVLMLALCFSILGYSW